MDRCAKVETKSEEAYTKADVERIHLQQEVESVRAELGKYVFLFVCRHS